MFHITHSAFIENDGIFGVKQWIIKPEIEFIRACDKLNGILNSTEFANCLNVTLDTAIKAIQKGILVNPECIKAIEVLVPSSPTALLYNHQNLSKVAEKSHAITEYFCKAN